MKAVHFVIPEDVKVSNLGYLEMRVYDSDLKEELNKRGYFQPLTTTSIMKSGLLRKKIEIEQVTDVDDLGNYWVGHFRDAPYKIGELVKELDGDTIRLAISLNPAEPKPEYIKFFWSANSKPVIEIPRTRYDWENFDEHGNARKYTEIEKIDFAERFQTILRMKGVIDRFERRDLSPKAEKYASKVG